MESGSLEVQVPAITRRRSGRDSLGGTTYVTTYAIRQGAYVLSYDARSDMPHGTPGAGDAAGRSSSSGGVSGPQQRRRQRVATVIFWPSNTGTTSTRSHSNEYGSTSSNPSFFRRWRCAALSM